MQLCFCQLTAQMFRPLAGIFLNPPAETEIGRIQVQAGADENPGKEQVFLLQSRILQRLVSHLEHQQLARQHLLHLFRRNAEGTRCRSGLGDEIPLEIGIAEAPLLEPAALLCPPPVFRLLRARLRLAAEQAAAQFID